MILRERVEGAAECVLTSVPVQAGLVSGNCNCLGDSSLEVAGFVPSHFHLAIFKGMLVKLHMEPTPKVSLMVRHSYPEFSLPLADITSLAVSTVYLAYYSIMLQGKNIILWRDKHAVNSVQWSCVRLHAFIADLSCDRL